MWRTQEGERVLRGAEWGLLQAGLDALWDLIEAEADDPGAADTGIGAFDALRPPQKLALLALVGKALRDEAEPAPELTAHTEAAVAAVYRLIADRIEAEIDRALDAGPGTGRELVGYRAAALAAYHQALGPDEATSGRLVADVRCEDLDAWESLVDLLANRILWDDDDYLMDGLFLDCTPEAARRLKEELGIDEDYYTAPAPDPTEAQVGEIRRTLREVCGLPEPEPD
jgi:hypothetical protein